MWALAAAVYAGCKWLTWRHAPDAPAGRQLAYLLLWPGLDAPAFLRGRVPPDRRPTGREWLFAAAKLAFGAGLVWGVSPVVPAGRPLLRGWVGMAGIVFVLHFGLFHLLSCFWRARDVDAKPLMNWPVRATSLAEFWGKRWNTAFRDMTHRFLFRPLAGRLGPRGGLAAGFLFSGVVHDVVISVPAGGGYGRPTAYFLVQGLGLVAERTAAGKRLGLGRGPVGWLFTAAVLILPAGWLFHPPFVTTVVLSFLDAIGAGRAV